MKKILSYCILNCCSFFIFSDQIHAQQQFYPIIVTTTAHPPVSPFIDLSFGKPVNGITVTVRETSGKQFALRIIGKLERLSPSPFTITRNLSNVFNLPGLDIGSFQMKTVESFYLIRAFDGFRGPNLQVSGISLRDLDSLSTRLPPGQYRICFYAVNASTTTTYLSDPNSGCAFFNICNTDPPQFIQPVNNLSVSSNIAVIQPGSPVTFTWTPPLSTCGSSGFINYDLEIREILNNQNVIDALNNPVIFKKASIPSTTFLLDLNLYQDVLKRGRKYAIRVKASAINAVPPAVIANNGYSRVEAFQFGSENAFSPNLFWNAQSYLAPLEKRKSDFWNDYENRKGKDTLVPVKEYIAYKLMQNAIAYSADAIELMLSLNPELKDAKEIKLSYPLNLPVFPLVTDNERSSFELAHATSLKPDPAEAILFRKYLDSLKASGYRQLVSANIVTEINDLVIQLDQVRARVAVLNRVSLNFMNTLLAEILFNIRKSNKEYNHLHNVISDLKALSVTSSLASIPGSRRGSLSSYLEWGKFALIEPLLSLDVVVYRPALPPSKPVMNAPDLKGVYRIFYTSSTLYNHKNPEINAQSPGRLASTTQVSLPVELKYKFWTLNMRDQKQTLPQDIDIDEIVLNSRKNDPGNKKMRIVLKVE